MAPADRIFTPAFLADPYPVYARLRAEAPVFWSESLQRWLLTRYADIDSALRKPHWVANRIPNILAVRTEAMIEELQPLARSFSKQMLMTDPPDHTRIRGLVNKTFTPRVVERMRVHIEQIVDGLLAGAQADRALDVIRDLAFPLPVIVICELLGIPPEDRQQFKTWSADFVGFLGNIHATPEADRRALRSLREASTYFQDVARRLRDAPRDDLLSALVAVEVEGDRLSQEELLANAVLLLSAGHETTTNLIGNGLHALLRHPEQLQRLRAEPALIGNAIEEFLRYDPPVQYTGRAAPADMELAGQLIRQGSIVLFVLAAANRDPAQFERPDDLDIGRRENRHLSFGHGIHYCLGAPLARLEAQVAITALLQRCPDLHLARDALEWQPNFNFRGLKALPVAW